MKNKYIAIIVILLVIISAGSVYMYFTMSNPKQTTMAPETFFYPLKSDFTTNLKDNNRYIKISVEFELSNKNLEKEIDDKNGLVRDTIISIMRSLTTNQVLGSEGQNYLRNEIKTKVSGALNTNAIKDVYFDDFIVQ